MTHSPSAAIAIALVDVALILLVRACLVKPARRLRQPTVIAEILAGVVLGPSALGLLPGDIPHRLFPTDVRPILSAIAEVGLVLFMFVVGWQVETRVVWKRLGAVATVSISSMALPFGGGVLLASWLYAKHSTVSGHHVNNLSFVLFVGVAMAITAFPVLARIIFEHGLQSTRVGTLALASAAVADALAWCLLAVVSAIVASRGSGQLVRVIGYSLAYVAALGLLVRPALRWLLARLSRGNDDSNILLTVVCAGIFASAFVTNWIGLDAIFGAFAFGMVMPKSVTGDLDNALRGPMEQIIGLLMPIFFIAAGLSIDVTTLGASGWIEGLAILAVACVGKFAGAMVPARICGVPLRESVVLGLLMNTRGLTELVILNVGRSLGVLDTRMFTMMVLMALVTTGMAGPLLFRAVQAGESSRDHVAEPGATRPMLKSAA